MALTCQCRGQQGGFDPVPSPPYPRRSQSGKGMQRCRGTLSDVSRTARPNVSREFGTVTQSRPPAEARRRLAAVTSALAVLILLTFLLLEAALRIAERVPRIRSAVRPAARGDLMHDQSQRLRTLLSDAARHQMLRLDPELGWRYAPGTSGDTISVNGDGQRSVGAGPVDFSRQRIVLSAWGDSFIFCTEVRDEDCWLARLQLRNPGILVRNFGVGGYGTDQALLRFRRTVDSFPPDIAILGFTEDDLRRLVNGYRRFVDNDEAPLFKPRFRVLGESLRLVPNPAADEAFLRRVLADPLAVRAVGVGDPHYNALLYETFLTDYSATARALVALLHRVQLRYVDAERIWDFRGRVRPQSEAFKLQMAIFEAFVNEARAKGIAPLILLLPSRARLEVALTGETSPIQSLLDSMAVRSMPFYDLAPAFVAEARRAGVDRLFAAGGHYSKQGNSVVALVADSLFRAGVMGPTRRGERSVVHDDFTQARQPAAAR